MKIREKKIRRKEKKILDVSYFKSKAIFQLKIKSYLDYICKFNDHIYCHFNQRYMYIYRERERGRERKEDIQRDP